MREYEKMKLKMWTVPSKSPDLNPIERYWAFLKKKLRAMDLKDALAKRPVLGKMAYRARVLRVIKSKKSQLTAKNIFAGFKRVCRLVIKKKGAASGK